MFLNFVKFNFEKNLLIFSNATKTSLYPLPNISCYADNSWKFLETFDFQLSDVLKPHPPKHSKFNFSTDVKNNLTWNSNATSSFNKKRDVFLEESFLLLFLEGDEKEDLDISPLVGLFDDDLSSSRFAKVELFFSTNLLTYDQNEEFELFLLWLREVWNLQEEELFSYEDLDESITSPELDIFPYIDDFLFDNAFSSWGELGEDSLNYYPNLFDDFSKVEEFEELDEIGEEHLNYESDDDLTQKSIIPLWGSFSLDTPLNFLWVTSQYKNEKESDPRKPFLFLLNEREKNRGELWMNLFNFSEINDEDEEENEATLHLKSYESTFSNSLQDVFFEEDEEDNFDIEIARIRFKPGYGRIWRSARSLLQTRMGLKYRYQSRLTKYIIKLRLFVITKHKSLNPLRIDKILFLAQFFWNENSLPLVFDLGLIYLNGLIIRNRIAIVARGDLIQVSISLQYYISYFVSRLSWKSIIWRERDIQSNLLGRRARRQTPPNIDYGSDIPNFLEVDFLSLSCWIIYDSFLSRVDLINKETINISPILYMYNWKYIN